MAKAKVIPDISFALPENARVEFLSGAGFVKVREAARLGAVHPVVLEMAQTLIKTPGNTGAAFALATPDLQQHADAILKMFRSGLRKAAKALDPEHKHIAKVHRDGNRLVCWYA